MAKQRIPELMGAAEVAEAVGIDVSNIDRTRGLPESVGRLRATRLWLAADINEFVKKREQREAWMGTRRA